MIVEEVQKLVKDKEFSAKVVESYWTNKHFKELLDKMKTNNFDFAELLRFKDIILKYWKSYSLCQEKKEVCQQENKGFQFELKFENTYLFLTLKKCLHKNDFSLLEKNYLCADFPRKWMKTNLKTEIKNINDKKRNLLINFYINLSNNVERCSLNEKWLFLTGNFTTGKTFLTAAFAHQFIWKNRKKKVMFINATNLSSRFFEKNVDFKSFIKDLKEVELLVIDDFGVENRNIYFRDEFLLPVFQHRFNLELATVIISNFTYLDLKKSYSFSGSKVETIKVESLFGLFQKGAKFLTLTTIFKE